jgi:hypothetical protein
MTQFNKYSTQLAGGMLLAGPALIVSAALLAAAGIGTTTGRWYDNWLEGILMVAGFSLQLVGLLELYHRIGARRPVLGIVTMLMGVVGTSGAILPSAVRIFAAAELRLGFIVEQLDIVHGLSKNGTDPLLIVFPFVLCFFLGYLLLAFGLWKTKTGPRYTSILLVAGTILFIIGQSSFEVMVSAYLSGVIAWLLGLAPLGIELLREAGAVKHVLSRVAVGSSIPGSKGQ